MSTANGQTLKAPFPAFGGKSAVAAEVWARFGSPVNFVEPFCRSCAVLLGRPEPWSGCETVNDLDGMIANFWRAVQAEPDAVAYHADWPVNENDLHARHAWLVARKDSLQARLEGCPDFYDSQIAGWWCWGACCWIGTGWCSGEGPWQVVEVDGARQLVHLGNAGQGVNRQIVHLGDAGQGVNRQIVHLGNAGRESEPEACVTRKMPDLINPKGILCANPGVYDWMQALAARLKRVRVCCGDWSRVCGPTPTVHQGLTAVFLDPPYGVEDRADCYDGTESRTVSHDVRRWCLEHGNDPRLRIALCGYDGEHNELEAAGWDVFEWKARGGYGSQAKNGNDNAKRERIWFSPSCLTPHKERTLF